MKNLVVNSIMNNITKYYNYDDTKLDEIKYGIESLYLTISKTIIILSVSQFRKVSHRLGKTRF